jgi:hypothetical protein
MSWLGARRQSSITTAIRSKSNPVRVQSRLDVYRRLVELEEAAIGAGESQLATRLEADLAYLRALLGERMPISEYVRATQGSGALGWPSNYIVDRCEAARRDLERLGVDWGPDTESSLRRAEGPIDIEHVPAAIHEALVDLEPKVRDLAGTGAEYELSIELVDVEAYWSYWLDGAGGRARLRINRRNPKFTEVAARQFALHEVLGHALQGASLASRCADDNVEWIRLLSVHAQHQILFEGLAQSLPLFVAGDDEGLVARVRLAHYLQLVRAELHLAVNSGFSIGACLALARERVPFWTEREIEDTLADRSIDPLLRSYLWSYPAGLDWFVALADADHDVQNEVLHAAYLDPLTPKQLMAIWPSGPAIGGPGGTVYLRKPALS